MDTMTPIEISLPVEREKAYRHLYDSVQRLLKTHFASYADGDMAMVSQKHLTICRAALFDIDRLQMIIALQEGHETKTLSPEKE